MIIIRKRRGNCYCTACGWASLGWYRVEDNKGWRRCYICCWLQSSQGKVYAFHTMCVHTLTFTSNNNWKTYLFVWSCIRHLNGTVLESFVRPAVLITDAYNALNNQPPRQQREIFQGILFFCCWLFCYQHNSISLPWYHVHARHLPWHIKRVAMVIKILRINVI